MIGDYILHFPLTDFAVSLLALAALIDVGRLVLKRAAWATTVDLLLAAGFLGALAAVGSGLWLISSQGHAHDDLLSIHHWFAYGTLAAASASVIARLLQKRSAVFGPIKSMMLVVAALLVSGAGFYGGKMAHPPGEAAMPHTDAQPHGEAAPHTDTTPHETMPPSQHGAMAPTDAQLTPPATTSADAVTGGATAPAPPPKPAPAVPDGHGTTPHSH